jgi:hypothetical protein
MAELAQPFSCDVCGVIKQDSNHWYRVWKDERGRVIVSPWEFIPEVDHSHLCGPAHMLKRVAELMDAKENPGC